MRMQQMDKVIYSELSYKVCGLCFKIHNDLGQFRSEKSYADALEEVLKTAGISYQREQSLGASFAGENERRNIPDFMVEDKIVVDLKAKRVITKEDYYQMKRYLVASGKKLGLIINFRQKYLAPKRILN